MLATLAIFFRESLEASLIVGIIIAYLRRIERTAQIRAVWLGTGIAIVLDVIIALTVSRVIHHYDGSRMQTVLEGITFFLTAAMLTGMSFWMKQQSRGLRRTLEAQLQQALDAESKWAVGLLSGLTVGREGLETVFFMIAIAFSARPLGLASGALLGLGLGLLVTYLLYRAGRRVPLGWFFNVLGVLLLVFAAGFLGNAVEDFQVLHWIPFGTQTLWNTGQWVSESSVGGDLLHTFLGYAQSPTWLQATAYLAFLATSIGWYLRGNRPPSTSHS